MTPPDPTRLEAIRERMAKATEGPWRAAEDVSIGRPRVLGPQKRNGKFGVIAIFPMLQKLGIVKADAEFIAHAREDIPWLLATLQTQAATIARLEGELDEALTQVAFYEKRAVERAVNALLAESEQDK